MGCEAELLFGTQQAADGVKRKGAPTFISGAKAHIV